MDHDSDGEITLEEWLDYFAAVKHEKCRIANDPEVSCCFATYWVSWGTI